MKVINTSAISFGCASLLLLLSSCTAQPQNIIPEPKLYQSWQLKLGDQIGGSIVTGGLGDISIALNGKSAYAPSDGETSIDKRGCIYFTGVDAPGYRFRLCGLKSSKLGKVKAGDAIASGDTLQFATLLKQSNDTWALVEPDKSLLTRILTPR